ncbi:MAG: AbiU2 domain-containing protein [Dehalococcoidia bacterium]
MATRNRNIDRLEFKRQLDELQKIISEGIACLSAWQDLNVEDKESAAALNRYKGLFMPARVALLNWALMQFAKVFDRDTRTVSLRNLVVAAKGNMKDLLPYARENDLIDIETKINAIEGVLEKLKTNRDQRLAHRDSIATSDNHLLYGEVLKLVDDVDYLFNILSRGHENGTYSFDQLVKTSRWHTSEVIRIMVEDREKALKVIRDLDKQGL